MLTTPNIAFLHQLVLLAEHRILSSNAAGKETSPEHISQQIEDELKKLILSEYPKHNIKTSSSLSITQTTPFEWFIRQFNNRVDHIPVNGIFIGMTINGKSAMCMLSHPSSRERYWFDGIQAQAFGPLGDFTLSTRQNIKLNQSVIHISAATELTRNDVVEEKISPQALLIRRGDPHYAIGMLVAGYIDACVIVTKSLSAFIPFTGLIEKAGGCLTIYESALPDRDHMIIISGSHALHQELQQKLVPSSKTLTNINQI